MKKEGSVLPDSSPVAKPSACCVWEIRYNADRMTAAQLVSVLRPLAKKFVFQLESGDTGYLHYQGRISLFKKRVKSQLLNLFADDAPNYLVPTVLANKSNDAFYCMKKDTRIGDEIYTDEQEAPIFTRQVAELHTLYPFQQFIVDRAKEWDKRTINVVYCPYGNLGKSSLVQYCRAHRIGRPLPPVNDAKDLLRIVHNVPTSRMYLFDMPRAMNKTKLSEFFTAVECIKDGYAYDDRNRFKEKVFDCPNIWIFTNSIPDMSLLSHDRWKMWTISIGKTLDVYNPLG